MQDIHDFTPYLRFCSTVNRNRNYMTPLCAYDHRLFYILSGGFTIQIEGRSLSLSGGDLLIFPPGVPYRILYGAEQSSEHIIINFDFNDNRTHTPPRTPLSIAAFRSSDIISNEHPLSFDGVFLLREVFSLADSLRRLCEEGRRKAPYYREIQSAELKRILFIALRLSEEREERSSPEHLLCEQVRDYLHGVYTQDIKNEDIAQKFGYHPYYLNKLFLKHTGETLHQYVLLLRIQSAKEKLLQTDFPLDKIALSCGFNGLSYFAECFKKRVGVSPSAYRERAK